MTAAPFLSIETILTTFPTFRVAACVVDGLILDGREGATDHAAVERVLTEAEAMARTRLDSGDLPALPAIRDWRAAYRAFGIKQTRYRNSLERLLRRLRTGEALPRINPLVDLYNAISIRFLMPSGADDLDRIEPPLAFRQSTPGDSFLDMAADPPTDDPPLPGEIVYADSRKILCRRWNWRQDARSLIGPHTRRAIVTIQTLDPKGRERLDEATEEFVTLAARLLGARTRSAVADIDRPSITVADLK